MFKKRYKLEVFLDENDHIKINHNLENLPPEHLQLLITSLINGQVGIYLLKDIKNKNPQLSGFLDSLILKLFPIPPKTSSAVIKPSQVLPNFLSQIKGMISE